VWEEFNAWVIGQGAAPLPDLEFIHDGTVNLYIYPELADYRRSRPLGPSWHRLDSSVRETDEEFALPGALAAGEGALIYFSLGSLGSADVELMRRVIDCLSATPYRYVVSKGPLHAEIDLASNMTGAEFLPQTSVIPLCDAVITHGGNNTVTECLHFGKPMIVLPLFWDQHDNAQRVHELGLGVRLDTYRFTDAEMHGALGRLLTDAGLRTRLAGAADAVAPPPSSSARPAPSPVPARITALAIVSAGIPGRPGRNSPSTALRRTDRSAPCGRRGLVLRHDAGRDAPPLTDRHAVVLRPGPDVTAALTAGRGAPGPAHMCPPGLAGVLDEWRELPAERGGVLLAQVDLVIHAAEPETHGLRGRSAAQVIFQGDSYPLGHPYLPLCDGCLHRIPMPVPLI